MNLFVIIAIIAAVFIVSFFVFKSSSEKKAKANYKPPVPETKTSLPEIEEISLPAKSENRLRFCRNCGSANSDRDTVCSNCGKLL